MEIRGRLPTNSLHTALTKILSKHLAANKKVSFACQQKSSMVPIMNPSPAEITDLFNFVEVTLAQYSTLTGVTAAKTRVKRKRVKKVEVIQEEPPREEPKLTQCL